MLGTVLLGGGIALATGGQYLAPVAVMFLWSSVKALTLAATGLHVRALLQRRRHRRNVAAPSERHRRAA